MPGARARIALRALCALTGMGMLAAGAQTGGPAPTSDPAVPGFHWIPGTFDTRLGPDGNTEIYTAPSGLIVIDTGRHPAHARKILDYTESEGLPVVAIINTHWHPDHATGNLDIKAAYPGVEVFATPAITAALGGFLAHSIEYANKQLEDPATGEDQRAQASRFLAAVDRGVLLPDVSVEAGRLLPVIGRDLELHVTHDAVTESDIWIWDPATRTVIAGDLVTLPAPLFDTACVNGWQSALDDISRLPIERVVPGHGDILTAKEFGLYRDSFDRLVACAAQKTGAECAPGWLLDTAPLLGKAPGEDDAARDYARAAVTYYVDEIIRSPVKQAELCEDAGT